MPLPEWLDQAACAGIDDPDIFYNTRKHAQAIAICRTCPVRLHCLTSALETGETHGIHGGIDMTRHGREARQTCTRGHTIGDVGLTPRGKCRQCARDQHNAYRARQRATRKAEAA